MLRTTRPVVGLYVVAGPGVYFTNGDLPTVISNVSALLPTFSTVTHLPLIGSVDLG